MTRIAKDLPRNHTTTEANNRQAVDTYSTPYYRSGSSLAEVARALEKWNPVFTNYINKKAKEQYDREVEEGKAIAMHYADSNTTLDQIEKDIGAGNNDRYRRLTHAMKEGINQMQMTQGLNTVTMKMIDAYENATFPDAQGTPHRLYEAEDPLVFQKWFHKKFNETWETETGGKYDKALYGELGSQARATVQTALYNKFLKSRGEMIQYEADKAMTQALDTSITPILNSGRYINNPALLEQTTQNINRLIQTRSLTGSPEDGDRTAANYIVMQIDQADTYPEINYLTQIAKKTPLWNNPIYRDSINKTAQQKETQLEIKARQRQNRRTIASQERAENTLKNELLKLPGANGRPDYNRLNEVKPQVFTLLADDRNALSYIQEIYDKQGRNIILQDQVTKLLLSGAKPDWKTMIETGALPISYYAQAQTIEAFNQKTIASDIYQKALDTFDKYAPPIDISITNDPQEISDREKARQQFAYEISNSLRAQGISDTNTNSFQTAFTAAAATAADHSTSPTDWTIAAHEWDYNHYGTIARTVYNPQDITTFFADTDILTDPDFRDITAMLLFSRGAISQNVLPDIYREAENKLRQKNYKFNGTPIETFRDIQYIASKMTTDDYNTLIKHLKGTK